jgi:hypothetical protein
MQVLEITAKIIAYRPYSECPLLNILNNQLVLQVQVLDIEGLFPTSMHNIISYATRTIEDK